MITGVNPSRTLANHISYKLKCKSDARKCNSNQKWNNNMYQRECKNAKKHCVCKKKVMVNMQEVLLTIQ